MIGIEIDDEREVVRGTEREIGVSGREAEVGAVEEILGGNSCVKVCVRLWDGHEQGILRKWTCHLGTKAILVGTYRETSESNLLCIVS